MVCTNSNGPAQRKLDLPVQPWRGRRAFLNLNADG
jgi:hypothetical protein